MKDKKSKFLLKSDLGSRSTNFKPSLIKEASRNLTGIIDSQRLEIDHTITGCKQSRQRSTTTSRRTVRNKIGIFVKLVSKVFMRLKNWGDLRIDEFSRRRLIENQDTIMNSRLEFRNYRMKSIAWVTREIVRMPSQYAQSSRSLGMPSPNNGPPEVWNSHGRSGNVFANPRASSSSHFPGELNPWISHVTEDTLVRTSTGGPVTCDERQIPDTVLNPKFQTGPSVRNSFDPKGGKILKELWSRPTKTADLGTSLWQIPNSNNIRLLEEDSKPRYVRVHTFLRKQCYGSKKWRWLNQWMIWNLCVLSEELLDQTFELLDARIASALNRIIQNSRFKKKVSLEEMKAHKEERFFEEDRSLAWSTNTSGSPVPMILLRIMPMCLQSLFEMTIFSGIRYKMGWNSIVDDENPIWWHHESLRNPRPYWNCTIGDSPEESRNWLSQIEDYGKKK